jgi:type VI secretion system secreted protein Hcp
MGNGNIWIKIDGIKGKFVPVPDAIEVESFSWGVHNAQGASKASGESQAGKAHFGELNITRACDVNSPKIMEFIGEATAIKKIEFGYMKQINSANQTYIKLILEESYFISQQIHGSGENPTESISIAYAKIRFEYCPEKPDKKGLEGAVGGGFDIKANKKV